MKLFVFEGKKTEPKIFETLKELFFSKREEQLVCTYNSNIYSLYSHLSELEIFKDDGVESAGRTLSVLNSILEKNGDNTLSNILDSDVSEIFLFFDYDFHESRLSIESNNSHIEEMLTYFNDETLNGKLYINYPMIESIRYHKELPDLNYKNYVVLRENSKDFKSIVHEYSFYNSLDYILLSNNPKESIEKQRDRFDIVVENWRNLVEMNICKANYICNDDNSSPKDKLDILQNKIFENQLLKYVNTEQCCVAILNAFPLFIYDYFEINKIFLKLKNDMQKL